MSWEKFLWFLQKFPPPRPTRRTSDDIIVPLAVTEKEQIIRAYRITGGNKLQTARSLEINPNTLRAKLRSYGIE